MPSKKTETVPWERQEGEGVKPYEAFLIYLEMGEKRILQAVADRLHKSYTLIRRWKDAYNWVERCRAWDNYLQREAKKAAVSEVRAMNKRHIQIAIKLQDAAMEALAQKGNEIITEKNLATIVKLATDLERGSREAEVEATAKEADETVAVDEEETVHIYLPDNGRM